MEPEGVRLTSGELAVLDALVAVAQQIGIRIDTLDDDDCENHVCDEHGDDFMGRWQDTRHEGVVFAYVEHEILPHLRELSSQIDTAPTLRRLVELRGAATRHR